MTKQNAQYSAGGVWSSDAKFKVLYVFFFSQTRSLNDSFASRKKTFFRGKPLSRALAVEADDPSRTAENAGDLRVVFCLISMQGRNFVLYFLSL